MTRKKYISCRSLRNINMPQRPIQLASDHELIMGALVDDFAVIHQYNSKVALFFNIAMI
jgi:hypothetical protein